MDLKLHLYVVALMGTPAHLQKEHADRSVPKELDGRPLRLVEQHILAHAMDLQDRFGESYEQVRRLAALDGVNIEELATKVRALA